MTTALPATDATPRLAHLPLALFAAPMGIGGLGLAWREAVRALGAPAVIGEFLLAVSGLLWCVLAVLHLIRIRRAPQAVIADLRHPIRVAFTGAIGIGLVIMSVWLAPYALDLARLLWLVAVAVQMAASVWILRLLIQVPRDAATMTPPLLIPLVGSLVASVPGASLGFANLSWMLFGIGLILWFALLPLLVGRLAQGPELPLKLRPTLAIFLAPPAVASLAMVQLTGAVGPASIALLGFAAFIALVLVAMWRDLAAAPFSMAWWGVTFPSAAFTTAVMVYFRAVPLPSSAGLQWALLVASTLLIGGVALRTARVAAAGQLLRPE